MDQDDAFVEKYGLALMESAFESYLPADEVQQGCWRTGKMFGIEHYDIIPDGIIMGKSVGDGRLRERKNF